MELRRQFEAEAICHRGMLAREKQGRSTVSADFREFRSFLRLVIQAIGRRPDRQHQLDRIDNADREYGPGKVRWALPKQQCRNRSTTIMAPTSKGGKVALADAADKHGLLPDTVRHRLRAGWSMSDALTYAKGARRPKAAYRSSVASPKTQPCDPKGSSVMALWHAWTSTWAQTFPHALVPVPWTAKQCGQARILAKRVAYGFEPAAFFSFAVERWRYVTLRRMSTRGATPELPEIGFLAKGYVLNAFWSALASEHERAAIAALPDDDRALATLQADGYPSDEARKELKRLRQIQLDRDKLHQARAHIETTVRALERERAALASQRQYSERVIPQAPPPGQPIRLIDRPPVDHGNNPFEHPERAPDLEAMLAALPAWEEMEALECEVAVDQPAPLHATQKDAQATHLGQGSPLCSKH